MAQVERIGIAHHGIGEWIRVFITEIRAELGRRRVFRKTLRELNSLNKRELSDLGINRSMIRRLAHEAAYGA